MVDPNEKSAGSVALFPRRAPEFDQLGIGAWLVHDLAMRNDGVLREELPAELKALAMLFKA